MGKGNSSNFKINPINWIKEKENKNIDDCRSRDVVSGALPVRRRHVALLPRGARAVLHAAHGLRQVTSEASAASAI